MSISLSILSPGQEFNAALADQLNAEYQNFVDSLDFKHLICEHCGKTGFHRHGYYEKRITVAFGDFIISIRVLRVICTHCRHTHSVFPENLIGFSRLTLDTVLMLISLIQSRLDSRKHSVFNCASRMTGLDVRTVRRIWKKFLSWSDKYSEWLTAVLFDSASVVAKEAAGRCRLCFLQPPRIIRGTSVWVCRWSL